MKAFFEHAAKQLLVLLVSASVAFAQTQAPAPRKAAATQQELDQMLAPIALYPDSLLSQIFMASTYPLEVVEAARWSRANPGLKGEEAVNALEQRDWDASVKSLAAFPQVLAMMDQQLEWTARLGDVFIAQEPQVMETVQSLRQKAYEAGNLGSTEQAYVVQQGDLRHRAGQPGNRLRAVLRSARGVRIVVVAGLSARLLGALARLLRLPGIRFRLGRRHQGGRGIFLQRLRLAGSPRHRRECHQRRRESLGCSQPAGARENRAAGRMAARSRAPPGRAVSHRVAAAALRRRYGRRPAARIPVAGSGRPGNPQQLAESAGGARRAPSPESAQAGRRARRPP